MVDVTLLCLAAFVAAAPGGTAPALDGPRPAWAPAASFEEAVIRAQSGDSPFYEELPPAGGEIPQYPYSPGVPASPFTGPAMPGNPPDFGAPAFTAPGAGPAQYDPFTPQTVPPGGIATYG